MGHPAKFLHIHLQSLKDFTCFDVSSGHLQVDRTRYIGFVNKVYLSKKEALPPFPDAKHGPFSVPELVHFPFCVVSILGPCLPSESSVTSQENDEIAKKHGSLLSIQQIQYLRSVV